MSYEEAFAQVKSQRAGSPIPTWGSRARCCSGANASPPKRRGGRRPPDVSDPLSVPRTRVYRLAPHSEHDPRYLVAKPVEAVLDDTAIGDEDVAATVSASLWSTLDARGAFVVVAPPTSARDGGAAVPGVGGPAVRGRARAFVDRARARSRGSSSSTTGSRARGAFRMTKKKNEETKEPPKPLTSAASSSSAAARNQRIWRRAPAPGPTSRRRGRGRARRRRASRRTTRTSRCTSRVHRVRGRARGDGIRERRGQKDAPPDPPRRRKRASRLETPLEKLREWGAAARRRDDDDDDELKKSPLLTYPGFRARDHVRRGRPGHRVHLRASRPARLGLAKAARKTRRRARVVWVGGRIAAAARRRAPRASLRRSGSSVS